MKRLLIIMCLLMMISDVLWGESKRTIQVFYPSPYGEYKELRTGVLVVGEGDNPNYMDANEVYAPEQGIVYIRRGLVIGGYTDNPAIALPNITNGGVAVLKVVAPVGGPANITVGEPMNALTYTDQGILALGHVENIPVEEKPVIYVFAEHLESALGDIKFEDLSGQSVSGGGIRIRIKSNWLGGNEDRSVVLGKNKDYDTAGLWVTYDKDHKFRLVSDNTKTELVSKNSVLIESGGDVQIGTNPGKAGVKFNDDGSMYFNNSEGGIAVDGNGRIVMATTTDWATIQFPKDKTLKVYGNMEVGDIYIQAPTANGGRSGWVSELVQPKIDYSKCIPGSDTDKYNCPDGYVVIGFDCTGDCSTTHMKVICCPFK